MNKSKMKPCVIGLGHVGLPLACVLAKNGFQVIGLDVDAAKVQLINQGHTNIQEKELNELLMGAIISGSFKAVNDYAKVRENNVYIICVPTPLNEKGEPDLNYVFSATKSLAEHIKVGDLIILESTSPPGTLYNLQNRFEEWTNLKVGEDFYLSYCPERTFPGRLLTELVNNDRVVSGINETSTIKAAEFYSQFLNGKIYTCNVLAAELVKLFENTARNIEIAIANQFALICENLGVDAREIIKIANTHPRVNILNPGAGVGGSCVGKDPALLLDYFHEKVHDLRLVVIAKELNEQMPYYFVEKIIKTMKTPEGKYALVLGLAYKGNVSDTRESPSITIAKELQNRGLVVKVFDPLVEEDIDGLDKIKSIVDLPYQFDLIVLMTDHDFFKKMSPEFLKTISIPDHPILADGRGVFQKDVVEEKGFKYVGIGI